MHKQRRKGKEVVTLPPPTNTQRNRRKTHGNRQKDGTPPQWRSREYRTKECRNQRKWISTQKKERLRIKASRRRTSRIDTRRPTKHAWTTKISGSPWMEQCQETT